MSTFDGEMSADCPFVCLFALDLNQEILWPSKDIGVCLECTVTISGDLLFLASFLARSRANVCVIVESSHLCQYAVQGIFFTIYNSFYY